MAAAGSQRCLQLLLCLGVFVVLEVLRYQQRAVDTVFFCPIGLHKRPLLACTFVCSTQLYRLRCVMLCLPILPVCCPCRRLSCRILTAVVGLLVLLAVALLLLQRRRRRRKQHSGSSGSSKHHPQHSDALLVGAGGGGVGGGNGSSSSPMHGASQQQLMSPGVIKTAAPWEDSSHRGGSVRHSFGKDGVQLGASGQHGLLCSVVSVTHCLLHALARAPTVLACHPANNLPTCLPHPSHPP